jgi:hypothetical protein
MPEMAHDVFISYANQDKAAASAAVAAIEGAKIRCWIAYRDLVPGTDWGAHITDALNTSRVMVLIFSGHANGSVQIQREVERAVHKGIPILPLRIEDIVPTRSLEYFISSVHWLDALTPPLETHLRRLVDAVRAILAMDPVPQQAPTPVATTVSWLRTHRQQAALIGLGAVALVAVILAVWWYALASAPRRQAAAIAAQFTSATLYPAKGGVDPGAVGSFTLETIVVDFNTHYVDTINADGTFVLTGLQEEDGTGSGDANGNYRNVGSNTSRVHTGTVQIIDDTHFRSGTTVYQLIKPVLPRGQPNPSLLGTWTASGNVAGQLWNWTWKSTTPGSYHFEGHFSDHGHTRFANGLWSATSLVTGQSGGGTYGLVDATHILINGVLWSRQ